MAVLRSAWCGGLVLAVMAGTPSAWAQSPAPAGAPVEQRLVFLLERLEQLEREMRQMRGDIEEMNHGLQDVKRRQRELYLDVDRRLRELELGASNRAAQPSAAPVPTVPAAPAGPSPQTGTPPRTDGAAAQSPAAPSADERRAYETAFNLLKEGRYPQSIEALQRFLESYPQSSYADNAQYWLGEANYVSRQYKTAAAEFEQVIERYPNSSKVADAMLKLGFTRYELKEWDAARATLQQVVSKFPNSTAARLAETRLQRMRQEGR